MSTAIHPQCIFCHILLSQPIHRLECNHLICDTCYLSILTNNSSQSCPLDGKDIFCENVVRFACLQEYINGLMVECQNNFCEWKGFAVYLQNHLDDCSLQLVDCQYEECNTKLARSLMLQHENDCMYRPIKCLNCCHYYYKKDEGIHKVLCVANVTMTCKNEGCGVVFPCTLKRNHYKLCDYEEVTCENVDCFKTMLRKDLFEHTEICLNETVMCNSCMTILARKYMVNHQNECSEKLVSCEAISCKSKVLRKDLENHMDECEHVKIICPSEDCMNRFRRSYLQKHLETCACAEVPCEQCGEVCKRFELVKHNSVCSRQLVYCLYGCNEKVERGQLHDHINKCPAVVMEACRYTECQFKGTKSDCTKHEATCRYGSNNKENSNLPSQFHLDTFTSDASFKSVSNSLHKDSTVDTVDMVVEEGHTDDKREEQSIIGNHFSFGKVVWEYETKGIKIADEAIGVGELPETPRTTLFDDAYETHTTQLECTPTKQSHEYSPLKSCKTPKHDRSPITPYKKIRPRKHSSPLSISSEKQNNANVPNAFISNWTEFEDLKKHVHLQEQEIVRLKQSSYKIQSTVEQLEKEKSLLCTEVRLLRNESQCFVTSKIVWEIDNISCKLDISAKEGRMIPCNSPAFHNSIPGYKCMAMAYVYHQSDNFKGLQLGFMILKGKYDSILKWPFRKQVIVSILTKNSTDEKLLLVVDELTPDCCCQPMEFNNDQQIIGFVTYNELQDYIFDDTLILQCGVHERKTESESFNPRRYTRNYSSFHHNNRNPSYYHQGSY